MGERGKRGRQEREKGRHRERQREGENLSAELGVKALEWKHCDHQSYL